MAFLMQVIPTLEFALERKLTAKRPLHAPFTPQCQIGVGREVLPEIQSADILKHLLHDGVIHVLDLLGFFSRRTGTGRSLRAWAGMCDPGRAPRSG